MKTRPKLRKRSHSALMELKPTLDRINDEVEREEYIQHDPVQFMHAFSEKRDIEIAGFFAALMAWGRRDIVISKVAELMERIGFEPYRFVSGYDQSQFDTFRGFKHRTFKPVDLHGITMSLQQIYHSYEDFEAFWEVSYREAVKSDREPIGIFYERFLQQHPDFSGRSLKHLSNPETGSTAKRLCMYLRWCCRQNSPVDTGIWNFLDPSELYIPFDVHVARQARRYGLLTRRTNDWKAVTELTETLRIMNPDDPSRYDYALFGIGALGYELPKKFLLNKTD